ncbi:NAD(P)/FAD-dependent oxidoreductase [Pseudonocardia spinosispora]|uniref:NAD(P)/FAD-dependent oxidoreductase n=1 Tax=Pseudonocardia spinosispora TaxID=103441 RepID=UPI00146FB247|nr:FAD-dependent monooxygenase [Pseudonocardia spinosispora]
MPQRCDVVIIGARLAGACAAAHLAKAGLKVIVLDRSRFPSDQMSTHLLFPDGVNELRMMGALDGIHASNPTRSPWLQLSTNGEAELLERWRQSGPIDYCMCVPRTIQDIELVTSARAAGADVRERHRLVGVLWRGGRAVGVRYADADGNQDDIEAKLVIGADGRRSSVASEVGAFRPYRASRNGRGLVFRYADDPMYGTREGKTIYQWRDGDSIGFMFPSAPGPKMLMLFMGAAEEATEAMNDQEGYWQRKLAEHPQMAERVAGCTDLTKLRATGDTSAYFRASSGPGWALAGDAGHFKDPVIGQGQRDALWSGRRLAEVAGPVLDDPGELDLALRRWERERDMECVHAYHFGNIETEIKPVSPVLVEIVRRSGRSRGDGPDIGDVFGRGRTLPQVLTIPRLIGGLSDALRRGTGGEPVGATVRGAIADLKVHLGVRQELLGRRFRYSGVVVGSEHPDPKPPAPTRPVARISTDLIVHDNPTETVISA